MQEKESHLGESPLSMRILSPAFQDGAPIPARYTADGEDISPPLRWTNPPTGTNSLAILCEDPDAPSGTFVHWVAWNIKPDRRHCDEGVPKDAGEPAMKQGKNGFGTIGYAGPNPPRGENHHYHFRVFALDCQLDLPGAVTRANLLDAMRGHVLAEGDLTATYTH